MRLRLIAPTVLLASIAAAQTTSAPATSDSAAPRSQPTTQPSADQTLDQLLKPPANDTSALPSIPTGTAIDKTSGKGAVPPNAPSVPVLREGTFIVDRIGRLNRTADGQHEEFIFDSDGKNLHDAPLILLPNQKLVQMENAVTGENRDLKFRITGMVTEYRGRNYILLEKVVVVRDAIPAQF